MYTTGANSIRGRPLKRHQPGVHVGVSRKWHSPGVDIQFKVDTGIYRDGFSGQPEDGHNSWLDAGAATGQQRNTLSASRCDMATACSHHASHGVTQPGRTEEEWRTGVQFAVQARPLPYHDVLSNPISPAPLSR
ncbi:hypothetical protein PGT21_006754 [Puccinia graminis f. sp. tritici]|uniref:Uncharacterized protein n=2 Tax=Puccinia graminis f. sp. tritici TaxID=56615 RepID=H6QTQ7_PUCGT|nr:uncharacterized protein PGTG_22151 [Puccinia graminis f. sp. tritici CRL 75-36-700-3]EHS64272.1 hypothetical protein PGTG_22151 [Puccinia graminis f. sp. tritici CRL 75-36-700-3]KAA1108282.1 hypothetical protein PGT21_006754 [Puccinia graminis f. sp. tritici]